MSFFGLTALGPQNTFAATERSFRHIHVFDDNDFKSAWDRVNGRGVLHCHISKLDDIMRMLFRGPVPKNEDPIIKEAFSDMMFTSETEETMSFTSYMRIMDRLRAEAEAEEKRFEGKSKPTCQFQSLKELKETTRKCGHVELKLQEKQTAPLTAMQEYGWSKPQLQRPTAGRGQSDITKFQSELIKNGIYY